jgi:tripeptidyl-peptidase II
MITARAQAFFLPASSRPPRTTNLPTTNTRPTQISRLGGTSSSSSLAPRPLCRRATRLAKMAAALPSPTPTPPPGCNGNPSAFPFEGAMPRREIGATRWLQEIRPDADGRGAVIAIFDTGVDPGAPGLQVTPDGRPKILDVVDATGCGDVRMAKAAAAPGASAAANAAASSSRATTTPATADPHLITGASGRPLRVNPAWDNPSGEWRVGQFFLFDVLPGGVVSRLKAARRKRWAEPHARSLAAAAAALASHDAAAGSSPSPVQQRRRAELEAQLQQLKDADKRLGGGDDPGPIVDAVSWQDSKAVWRAAFDTTDAHAEWSSSSSGASSSGAASSEAAGEKAAGESPLPGSLASFAPLAAYRLERQHGTFSLADDDTCNFAVQFYEQGDVLSVVVDAGMHGTHVAGIAAAYFPDDPSACGVAPGAQIVSVKIGDTRQGSMETGTGLSRAIAAVLQHNCDLCNMSYGEPTAVAGPRAGRVVELLTQLPELHGVTFVSSAGNAGPALSTVGSPGGTAGSALIGVGAYVSETLAAAGHSARVPPSADGPGALRPSPSPSPAAGAGAGAGAAPMSPSPTTAITGGMQYNWSSRGPAANGAIGVSISAPGGAISSQPSSTLNRRALANGTSMSSPAACGALALVVSAVKLDALALGEARGLLPAAAAAGAGAAAADRESAAGQLMRSLRVSPWRLRRAAENTAAPLGSGAPDAVLTYGRGLIQVPEIYSYLRREQDEAGLGPPLFYDPRRAAREEAAAALASSSSSSSSSSVIPGGASLAARLLPLPQDLRYDVTVSGGSGGPPSAAAAGASGLSDSARGVYLREPHEAAAPRTFTVTLKPLLHEDAPPSSKLAIEDRLVLRTTEPSWVQAPEAVIINSAGRGFEVRVDGSRLPAGLHYAEVLAFDSLHEWRGPLSRVPITVIRPEALRGTPVAGVAGGAGSAAAGDAAGGEGWGAAGAGSGSGDAEAAGGNGEAGALLFASTHGHHSTNSSSPSPHTFAWHRVSTTAGQELRRFVAVPDGATWAELSVRAGKFDYPRLFLLRASQLAPAVRPADTEWRTALTLSPASEWSASFGVLGGGTLELTVAQFWSSAGDAVLDTLELSFHGVGLRTGDGEPSGAGGGGPVVLSSGAAPTRALLTSPLRRQKVKPEAKLTAIQFSLRPQPGAAVEPLARDEARDGLPLSGYGDGGGGILDGGSSAVVPPSSTPTISAPVYRLMLEYKLQAAEAGTYTASFPWANRRIYDGELLAQMSWTRDANGRVVTVDDAYPRGARLSKSGDYTVRLHLRHPSLALLETLKAAPIVVERALEPAVAVPVYGSFRAAAMAAAAGGSGSGNGVAVKEEFLNAGDQLPIFFGPVGLGGGGAGGGDDKSSGGGSPLPKDAAGRLLRGHLSAGLLRRAGGGHAPACFEIVCSVPPAKEDKKSGGGDDKNKKDKKKKTAAARVAEALRAARLQAMADLRSSTDKAEAAAAREQWEALGREVEAGLAAAAAGGDAGADADADEKEQGRLSLLLERLRAAVAGFAPPAADSDGDDADADAKKAAAAAAAARVDAAADAVIAAVDQTALAAFLALRAPDDEDGEDDEGGDKGGEKEEGEEAAEASAAELHRRQKRRQDAAKAALLEALKAKLSAALDLVDAEEDGKEERGGGGTARAASPSAGTNPSSTSKERARQALAQLRRWVDTAAVSDYQLMHARAAWRVHGTPALALKALEKLSSGGGDDGKPARRDACDLRARVLRSMGPGWQHVSRLEEAATRAKFPGSAGQTAA